MTIQFRSANERKRRGLWVLLVAIVLVCLAMDLVPRQGPPDFRYTGSDPGRTVTNFGWPVALFIYDTDVSPYWFAGPFAWLMPVVQLAVVVIVLVVAGIVRVLRTRARLRRE